jgi:hypothetical protein
MKNTTKLKIWGLCQLVLAIILVLLGGTVMRDTSWTLEWKPNYGLFVPGMFLGMLSLPIIFIGFSPEITKFSSKLHSETIDYAQDEMKEAISKSADTVIPTITPSIKNAVNEINGDKRKVNNMTKEEQLMEAKKLFDTHLIEEEEYKSMRKKILGIDD